MVRTWLGTGGNDRWSTSANWSPAGAPNSGDDLVAALEQMHPGDKAEISVLRNNEPTSEPIADAPTNDPNPSAPR